MGTALLEVDTDSAQAHLLRVAEGEDRTTAQRALYNLGYRFLTAVQNPMELDATVSALMAAVASNRLALRLDPADESARWNLALAQDWLDALAPPEDEAPGTRPGLGAGPGGTGSTNMSAPRGGAWRGRRARARHRTPTRGKDAVPGPFGTPPGGPGAPARGAAPPATPATVPPIVLAAAIPGPSNPSVPKPRGVLSARSSLPIGCPIALGKCSSASSPNLAMPGPGPGIVSIGLLIACRRFSPSGSPPPLEIRIGPIWASGIGLFQIASSTPRPPLSRSPNSPPPSSAEGWGAVSGRGAMPRSSSEILRMASRKLSGLVLGMSMRSRS